MQNPLSSPRDAFTLAQVESVIEAEVLEYDIGLELLDRYDTLVEDISEDFIGGHIDLDMDNLIHRTANLQIAREINWYNQRLRPYVTLSANGTSIRFNLGIFLPVTPSRVSRGGGNVIFQVECYDKLLALLKSPGRVYQAPRSSNVIDTIESLIELAGETNYSIDQTNSDVTVYSGITWDSSDRNVTYLKMINDLLISIGYKPLYVDEDGVYRSEPQELMGQRQVEWVYNTSDPYTIVHGEVIQELDFFDVPNKFIFYRDDPNLGLLGEGSGRYTVYNLDNGPTSINSRLTTIPKVYALEVQNQAALIIQGDKIVEKEMQMSRSVYMDTSLNPLHSHDDCISVTDSNLGISGEKYMVVRWVLNLNEGRTELELKS